MKCKYCALCDEESQKDNNVNYYGMEVLYEKYLDALFTLKDIAFENGDLYYLTDSPVANATILWQ